MLAKINSGATVGLNPVPITVEVDIAAQGFPAFNIVGLPDKAVEEAKERVRSALKNSGADFPDRRITVNLAPADLPKQGPAFDLPMALGIMLASGQLVADLADALVLGELSLDGSLRPAPGVLPLAMLAKERGWRRLFVPAANAAEAAVVGEVTVFPVDNLRNFYYHLSGQKRVESHPVVDFASLLEESTDELDFADIQGQETARRVLEIAAAGGHNVAMKGPPGAGKTLMARTLPSILPRLTPQEALEVTQIYSVTGNLGGRSFMTRRPFRSPHHTTSRIGLIGGSTHPTPGEISLAHRGVLFLDEFPEFPRHVLEALRQPLEDGQVTVSRAAGSLTFPASFILVAAFNPCPCGYYGSSQRPCVCPSSAIAKYEKRLSGPLLDRIDLHIEVPMVEMEKIVGDKADGSQAESSAVIRERVQRARDVQRRRFAGTKLTCNAEMGTKAAKKYCEIGPAGKVLLQQAMRQLLLSARGYYKVLKVARTIADLVGEETIGSQHLAEALQYRTQERKIF